MFFIFLTSGLFLGWSLGANDAANIYGTAVGTRMIKFRTAAITASIFILLGATIGGAGASHTLGKLGAVNALAGSFTVAFAAALTVAGMTKLKLPVSTSQAIVGAIIGWNFFSGSLTDSSSLSKIVSSWVLCPLLAAGIAIILFKITEIVMNKMSIHILYLDTAVRFGLWFVGALAAYSLGANNIANVMGVFVESAPFNSFSFYGLFTLSGTQILFAIGGVAIGFGVFTYSKKVMMTVGNDLFKLSPIAALIVVLSQAIVLFLFSSEGLENWLYTHHLPTIPLVPVSSSQAVIGAVIGIGIVKGGRNIKFKVLGRITSGWISTPLISGVISFIVLFFVQNVFLQQIKLPVEYKITNSVIQQLNNKKISTEKLTILLDKKVKDAKTFQDKLREIKVNEKDISKIIEYSEIHKMSIDFNKINKKMKFTFNKRELQSIKKLDKKNYTYKWELYNDLVNNDKMWKLKKKVVANKLHNKELKKKLKLLYRVSKIKYQEK